MSNIKSKIKIILRGNKFSNSLYSKLHSLRNKRIQTRTLNELHRLDKLSEEKIYLYQNKKLQELISFADENTDYYNKIFLENKININNLEQFKKIPFLTKDIIRKSSKALLNKKIPIENLVKKNTGGSTGKPLEFYRNTESGLQDYAFHFYQYFQMGYEPSDVILGAGAVVIPEEKRAKNIYWLNIGKNQAFGDYKLSILYLNKSTKPYYVDKLIELKPAILRGYPSLFDDLAHYILENKIELDFTIKGVSLTSEMCSENQRINIEKAFSTKVYFEYGHSEIAVLCHSDYESYKYKSYPSYGYVEVLDENGEETNIDEVGHIVVTGFLNKGMPFIRYRTEDMGRVSYKNGGVVHFSEINGRSQDYIITKDNNRLSISALTSWQHFDAFAHISKWQIVQEAIGIIEIFIIKGGEFTDGDENEIRQKIQRIAKLDINFNYVDSIPRTKGGKHLFMIQKLKI